MTTLTEAQFQSRVMDLAHLHGLHVHHCRPARMASGKWATPISGNKGFVDLVIAGPGGVLFRELKTDRGKLSPDQTSWLHVLETAGADAGVWRPDDWPSVISQELHDIARAA